MSRAGHADSHEGHEGAHRSIGDLERSMRDVDADDVRAYLVRDHEGMRRLSEYLRGLREVEYERGERGERWEN